MEVLGDAEDRNILSENLSMIESVMQVSEMQVRSNDPKITNGCSGS